MHDLSYENDIMSSLLHLIVLTTAFHRLMVFCVMQDYTNWNSSNCILVTVFIY